VLIDDLHFAPEEGRALFAAMAHAHPGERLMLVGTAHQGLPPDYLASLVRLPHVTQMTLDRLSVETVRRLLLGTLGSTHAARELTPRIAEESDGIPYFIFESIASLKSEGVLSPRPDGTWTLAVEAGRLPLPRPRSVGDLVQSRLARLPEEDRELLDAAACCGFEFDPTLVADALGQGRIPVLKRLGKIERKHRIVHSLGRVFKFDHHRVHSALYEESPLPLREEYHAALGATLADRERETGRGTGDTTGETACAIADHFLRGGRPERAGPYLQVGLRYLAGSFHNERALELAELALSAPGLLEGVERAKCLLTRARVQRLLGRTEDIEAGLRDAMALAEEEGLAIEVRRQLARHLWETGRADEAIALLEETELLASRTGDAAARGRMLGDIGNVHAHRGRYEEAADCYRRYLEVAREAGDRVGEAAALGSLAINAYEVGRAKEAQELFQQALPIFREQKNLQAEGTALGTLGLAHLDLGDFDEARDCFDRLLEISRETGYRRGEANALGNLGLVHRAKGRYGRALEHFEDDLRIRRETRDRWNEGIALQLLGGLYVVLGAREPARTHLERSLELMDEIGFTWGRVSTVYRLALLRREEGRAREAEDLLLESEAQSREIGKAISVGEALQALGNLYLEEGRNEEAGARLEEAVSVAEKTRSLNLLVAARAHLCLLGWDPEEVRRLIEEEQHRLYLRYVMEARFLLWKATGRLEDLDAAHRKLGYLVRNAPPAYRESTLEAVALHRRIREAARTAGIA
jgi:tetratricopeptide (TPR) repeat protein